MNIPSIPGQVSGKRRSSFVWFFPFVCIVSPAGDATGAEKGMLEVMSGVLNYLRKEQMELQYLLGKALPGPSSPHPQGI